MVGIFGHVSKSVQFDPKEPLKKEFFPQVLEHALA